MLDARRTGLAGGAATLLSSHAEHPRPATSDTTKGSQANRPTASKRVSSPPGRDPLLGVGRHRPPKSKQQPSKQQRDIGALVARSRRRMITADLTRRPNVSNRQQEAWGGEVRMPRWLRRVLRRPEPSVSSPEAAREANRQRSSSSAANADGTALGPMTERYRGGTAPSGKRR
jgi:hypothetical protein